MKRDSESFLKVAADLLSCPPLVEKRCDKLSTETLAEIEGLKLRYCFECFAEEGYAGLCNACRQAKLKAKSFDEQGNLR